MNTMSKYNSKEQLKCLLRLKSNNSISNESGIRKATLYNNPNIKERIEGLRLQQSKVPTPSQVKR